MSQTMPPPPPDGGGDVGLEVGERAELRSDDASERVHMLEVELLVGQ